MQDLLKTIFNQRKHHLIIVEFYLYIKKQGEARTSLKSYLVRPYYFRSIIHWKTKHREKSQTIHILRVYNLMEDTKHQEIKALKIKG